MPARSTRFRLALMPGTRAAGKPNKLRKPMPMTMARMSGLTVPIPGISCMAMAAAAITDVNVKPGRAARMGEMLRAVIVSVSFITGGSRAREV